MQQPDAPERPTMPNYSYYSNRQPQHIPVTPSSKPKRGGYRWSILIVLFFLIVGGAAYFLMRPSGHTNAEQPAASDAPAKETSPAAAATKPKVNECADNTAAKALVVSVSQRHMWACEGSTSVYDSKAITGNQQHAETLTPVGTYKIYAKQQDTRLTGSDATGTWNRPVSYWMPFLDNQYGTYGFHDATWRSDSEFGNVDPNTDDASHGCVELPLAAQAWIYNWAPVGTVVVIRS
jgi:lipoprotein-anchoring transpeptidase ErfK/SrfK